MADIDVRTLCSYVLIYLVGFFWKREEKKYDVRLFVFSIKRLELLRVLVVLITDVERKLLANNGLPEKWFLIIWYDVFEKWCRFTGMKRRRRHIDWAELSTIENMWNEHEINDRKLNSWYVGVFWFRPRRMHRASSIWSYSSHAIFLFPTWSYYMSSPPPVFGLIVHKLSRPLKCLCPGAPATKLIKCERTRCARFAERVHCCVFVLHVSQDDIKKNI